MSSRAVSTSWASRTWSRSTRPCRRTGSHPSCRSFTNTSATRAVPRIAGAWRRSRRCSRRTRSSAPCSSSTAPGAPLVPHQFLDLAGQAAGPADPARWHLLYDVLWRLVRENRDLLNDPRDPQVRRLNALAADPRREARRAETDEALRVEPQGAGAAPSVPPGPSPAAPRGAAAPRRGGGLSAP